MNETVPSVSSTNRCMPNRSRTSSVPATSVSTGQHVSSVGVPQHQASSPPGRRSRADSGIRTSGSAQPIAPWSQKTTSNDASGSGTSVALAWISGNSTPA